MKQNFEQENKFINELRRVLLKEWRVHFKNHLNKLDKDRYISALSEMLYFSMSQKNKPADLTFSFVYEKIFNIITRDWKEKLYQIRNNNNNLPIEDLLNKNELKNEMSSFLHDVIAQMSMFRDQEQSNQELLLKKFISYINPLFSYLCKNS